MDRFRLGFVLNAVAGFALLIASAVRYDANRNWTTLYPLAVFFFVLSLFYYIRWKRGR